MNTVSELTRRAIGEARKVVVGCDAIVERILVCLYSEGHVLLEGVPGVAKTLLARTMAQIAQGSFGRVQFTPDLMPADVVGTSIFDLESRKFHLRRGPVFTNILLADEINRAPAKTQSALLEAMQEGQVTIDGTTHILPRPFLVLATQNPVEYEGTYPLPEASLDRFFARIDVGYPQEAVEIEILERHATGLHAAEERLDQVEAVLGPVELAAARAEIQEVTVTGEVMRYLLALVRGTRDARELRLGASPRAAIVLMVGAKALAAVRGRDFVIPDDVQELLEPTLGHRLVLEPAAELEGLLPETFLERLLQQVEVPR